MSKKHARPKVDVGGNFAGAFATLGGLGRKIDEIAKLKVGSNAMGTNNWRGGLTWVGEQGPELINLQKGAQVIPNHRIGQVVGSPASAKSASGSGFSGRITITSWEAGTGYFESFADNAIDENREFEAGLGRMGR